MDFKKRQFGGADESILMKSGMTAFMAQKSKKTVQLYRVACYFVLNYAQFGEMHFQKGIEDN